MKDLLTHAEYTAIAAELDLPATPSIDGNFCTGSGAPMPTLNPATGEILTTIAAAGGNDVDLAEEKARESFDQGHWVRAHSSERKDVLIPLCKYISRRKHELAVMESLDSGKPIRHCETIEIPESIACLKWHAEAADKIYDQTGPAGDNVG